MAAARFCQSSRSSGVLGDRAQRVDCPGQGVPGGVLADPVLARVHQGGDLGDVGVASGAGDGGHLRGPARLSWCGLLWLSPARRPQRLGRWGTLTGPSGPSAAAAGYVRVHGSVGSPDPAGASVAEAAGSADAGGAAGCVAGAGA
jgi:hypothetical protein